MSRRLCCCGRQPKPEAFCCNPVFYKDFITLYGDSMAQHAEVSPKDWIALYVERPGNGSGNSWTLSHLPSTSAPYTCQCRGDLSLGCGSDDCECISENYYSVPNFDPNDPQDVAALELGRKSCCQLHRLISTTDGARPIYFAYKYSGCNLIWYPREFSFNYDPYIVQCNGFITRKTITATNRPVVQNSCFNWAVQENAGAAGDQLVSECTQLTNDVGLNETLPCSCSPHPHIHGGVYDSLYNRVNVKLSPYSLGYLPFMLPFSKPMIPSEAECCWCANSTAGNFDILKKGRLACFLKGYPFSDGAGKTISISNLCGPGFDCRAERSGVLSINRGYKRSCFDRGISPYLLRLSKDDHKMAYEIWGHGANASTINDYGASYNVRTIEIKKLQKDIVVEFKKFIGQKTKLRDQYIGTIHLEHHFEMYAYRSDDASASIEIQALQNNCNSLVGSYEGYGGVISRRGSYYRWTPWKFDSIMWQVRRAVPRRVMYKGSGVPLFQFDLVNMETKSFRDNIIHDGDNFDGAVFLSHYYRYFYGLIYFNTGNCEYPGDNPVAPEWDFSHYLNSYNYVRFWLEKMIETGVLKIKDHSIDISNEVNRIIESGNETPDGNLEIAEEVILEVGGTEGYRNLINFFDVAAGTPNAVTPKIIKDKLLNIEGASTWRGPSGDYETFRAFLPRRAVLPVAETKSGVTAWGYTGSFARLNDTNFGITGSPQLVSTAINDLPSIYDINDENSIFNEVLNPQRVICGLMGAFIIDGSGKITLFGYDLENPSEEQPCTDPFANWQPYVGCVPPYLLVTNLFQEDPENPGQIIEKSPEDIPDGRVIDMAFKRDFAVALVDFVQGGIAQNCARGPINQTDFTPADERSSTNINDDGGPLANVNGNNEYIAFNEGQFCALEEPFHDGLPNTDFPGGPRGALERRKPNAYRLKSWGSKAKQYGTFCGSNIQAEYDIPSECSASKIEYLRYNSEVNPILDGGFSRRYPGTNNFFIWTAVSSGVKHLAAIDDYGGIFITPQSDNTFNQSQKGLGVTYSSGYMQAIETQHPDPDSFKCRLGYHDGLGPKFNYYPHIPRPGYIKPEEWTQTFYNNITLVESSYKKNICSCWADWSGCNQGAGGGGGVGGGDGNTEICSGPLYPTDPITGCCSEPYRRDGLPLWDLTCVLLGSLVQYPDQDEPWVPRENDAQPRYTKVSCGLYNTLCLTNENKLEIYGSFVKVTPEGEPIIDENNPVIPAYIPDSLKQKAGTWNVTYACPIYCAGTTHSPIVDYSYNQPSPNNVIEQIESSGDYCICVTADKKVHIWGDASMVPGAFDPNTYQPGTVAYRVLDVELSNITEIVSIAAGVNSIYIHYKKNLGITSNGFPIRASVTYEFTRYNINGTSTEVPDEVQNSRIVDIGAGYLHAVAIYSKRLESKVWKANDFAEDTLKYQFKNFASLPFFFRRQAFFHALPGGWDYSKWLYGGICCSSLENPNTNPVSQQDPCAVLRYNIFNGQDDQLLSYSGNPHYFWMRSDWRRATYQSTETVQVLQGGFPNEPGACRPDIGLSVTPGGSNFSFMSAIVGKCLNALGPAWGTARPLKSQLRRDIRVPLAQECWTIPCTTDNNVVFVNPLINSAGALTAIGTEPPPRSGYKSTKDLFQKMTIFYGDYAPSIGQNNNTLQVCPIAKSSSWSYFKYAERHYYFGYDEIKDVWDIYENPDFLRETSEYPFVFKDEDEATAFGVGGCTLYGFGGGTGPNGGACAGCSGYYVLYNYPLTGPNYGIENVTETPAVVSDPFVQALVNAALGDTPVGETQVCNSCFSGIQLQNIERYLGPGGFMFRGEPTLDNVIRNEAGFIIGIRELAPMLYSHFYNRTIRRTQYVKNMLLGVSTNLGLATIPPSEAGTDYEKKSFSDVLGDPTLTEQYTPWRFSSSTKWIPICWRTPLVLPNTNAIQLSSKQLYFNYSVDQGNGRKEVSEDFLVGPFYEVPYRISSIPVFGESTGDFNEDIRLIQEFVTDVNYPGLVSLPRGLFEFYIQCKSNYATNPIYFFVKVSKLKTNGETTVIATSLIDTQINPAGDFTSPTGTDQTGTPTNIGYRELVTHCYFDQNVSMDEEDRLLVQFFIKGGSPDTNSEIGDTIYIKYQDTSRYTVTEDGVTTTLGITKYSAMQYTHVSDDINQPCFSGFVPEDPQSVILATRFDPNIVILRSTSTGPVIASTPVRCADIPCCGE